MQTSNWWLIHLELNVCREWHWLFEMRICRMSRMNLKSFFCFAQNNLFYLSSLITPSICAFICNARLSCAGCISSEKLPFFYVYRQIKKNDWIFYWNCAPVKRETSLKRTNAIKWILVKTLFTPFSAVRISFSILSVEIWASILFPVESKRHANKRERCVYISKIVCTNKFGARVSRLPSICEWKKKNISSKQISINWQIDSPFRRTKGILSMAVENWRQKGENISSLSFFVYFVIDHLNLATK